MQQRTLGQTALTVTPIGLGLAALGRPGYINLGHATDLQGEYEIEKMESHTHTVLDAAWDLGIRYFDAARSYGRAEAFLASWLTSRQIAPDMVTVGSKWGYTYTAEWRVEADQHEVKEHSPAVLQRQTQESLDLLGQYLDVYQIHSATLESGVLNNEEVLAELARLRDTGLKIGLSISGPDQAKTLKRAMDITFSEAPLFASVQATWNLLEQSAGETLRAAKEAGMGIIIKEALANGRLTGRNDARTFIVKRALLEEIAARYNTTIDALALAAVLAQPWVDVVLSGAATVEQLRSNAAAPTLTLSQETVALLQTLAEPSEIYWAIRSHLAWN